jgi:hypothetical protein
MHFPTAGIADHAARRSTTAEIGVSTTLQNIRTRMARPIPIGKMMDTTGRGDLINTYRA